MKRFASVPNRPGLKSRAHCEKSTEGTERLVDLSFNPFQRVSHREPGLQSLAGWHRSESTRRIRVQLDSNELKLAHTIRWGLHPVRSDTAASL